MRAVPTGLARAMRRRARGGRGFARRAWTLAACLAVGSALPAWPGEPVSKPAPAPSTAPGRGRPFVLGYMRTESPGPMNEEWFRRLRRFLENDAELRSALGREGYGQVGLIAAEGFSDLVQQMESPSGLDCVFCPALAFIRQIGDYTVVFQLKGPHDRGRPPSAIFQSGVIIVNAHHPLFRDARSRDQSVPARLIARPFASEPVALVSPYSAPGYISPCNELFKSGFPALPSRPVFCGSSEEVIKLVVSDVVGMGACEEGAVEEVLREYNLKVPREQILDVLLTTPGSPTDPVVFRGRFRPDRSELGRRLKNVLGRFFSEDRPGQIRLEDSSDEAFKDLRAAWDEFEKFKAELTAVEAR